MYKQSIIGDVRNSLAIKGIPPEAPLNEQGMTQLLAYANKMAEGMPKGNPFTSLASGAKFVSTLKSFRWITIIGTALKAKSKDFSSFGAQSIESEGVTHMLDQGQWDCFSRSAKDVKLGALIAMTLLGQDAGYAYWRSAVYQNGLKFTWMEGGPAFYGQIASKMPDTSDATKQVIEQIISGVSMLDMMSFIKPS